MNLSNKYNIPQSTIDKMIKDGLISCSWTMYEKIYSMYKEKMSVPGAVQIKVANEIAQIMGCSERTVRGIVSKMEK